MRVRVAKHAIYRVFAKETVVLNVEKGTYHGLNPTAGRMLVVLDDSDSIATAVDRLSHEYGVSVEQVEADVVALCHSLSERGLIDVRDGSEEG